MDIFYIILIIIIIILVILFFNFVFLTRNIFKEARNEAVLTVFNDKCVVGLNTVTNIAPLECCFINNQITSLKYMSTPDLVVSPNPVWYVNACMGFCFNGIDPAGDGTTCVGGLGTEKFQACLNASKPVNCTGLSNPIAASNLTLYYPYSATNSLCAVTKPCITLE